MTRLAVVVSIAALVLGVLAASPVHAQEPPAPETAEVIPINNGVTCNANQTRPWRKLVSGSYYLRSNFTFSCSRTNTAWQILEVTAVGRFGVKINGTWGPYSNGPTVQRSAPAYPGAFAQVEFRPAQDQCASNGNFRQYRFRVEYKVISQISGVAPSVDTGVVFLNGFEFLQCGDNEPGQ